MDGVLAGVKVVEMGHVMAMPAAGAMMADWGADVIKIEPITGELQRAFARTSGVDRVLKFERGEVHWMFEVVNRGKKGIAVDLKKDAGREIVYRLVEKSDIFMTNYEYNSLGKLKMDYATLSQRNPAIIYAFLTGYGRVGPDKDERGFDFSAVWARSGLQYLTGEEGAAPPTQRPGMGDRVAGIQIIAAVLAALLNRQKTGRGDEIELSLYHMGVWMAVGDIQAALVNRPLPKEERLKAANPLWNTYRSRDRHWFQMVMPPSIIDWSAFCRSIDMPDLAQDIRFTTTEAREENCRELVRVLDKVFASRDLAEWEKRLREHNIAYGRIQSPAQVINDTQALVNNFFAEIPHPVAGKMKLVNTPVKFANNPARIAGPAPRIGEHTREVLLNIGYTESEVGKLKEQGIIY